MKKKCFDVSENNELLNLKFQMGEERCVTQTDAKKKVA